jgi:hypothetical protein
LAAQDEILTLNQGGELFSCPGGKTGSILSIVSFLSTQIAPALPQETTKKSKKNLQDPVLCFIP